MSNEIEDLKKQVLSIAQTLSGVVCETNYNMLLLFFKGEEYSAYVERWKKKEETTIKEIHDATTVKQALDIALNFYNELFTYLKAAKVDTADKAMEIAHSFIKKYVPVALPLKAVRTDDVWLVDIDVGALAVKVAKVKVDARTGDILSYDIPTKKAKKAK